MSPDPLRVMLLAETRRTNRRLIELEQKVNAIMDAVRQLRRDPVPGGPAEDRLAESPPRVSVCPNPVCQQYYFPDSGRCAACGWTEPHECPPTGVVCSVCVVEDDEPDEETSLELTQPPAS